MDLRKLTLNELRIYSEVVGLMKELAEVTSPQLKLNHSGSTVDFNIMWNIDKLDRMRERYEIDKLEKLGWKDARQAYMDAKVNHVRHCRDCGVTPYTMTSKAPRFWVSNDLCSDCAAKAELQGSVSSIASN